MKRMLKKVTAFLCAALIITGLYAPVAKAAASTVIVHVKDEAGWGSMNVYNWGDAGETAGVWPGTELISSGDNWYTYTFNTEVDLNLVFSAKGGTPQSNNADALSKDVGECWIILGGEGEENDMGVAGVKATLYTNAEEGWPSGDPSVAISEVSVSTETQTEVPKTGESNVMYPIIIVCIASFVAMVVFTKKKSMKE